MLSRTSLKSLTAFVLAGFAAWGPSAGICELIACLPSAENTTQFCVRVATPPLATPERQTTVYQGTMNGNLVIGLALIRDSDQQLHGSFFYWRDLKDFDVQGEYTGEHDIVLRQLNAAGAVIGVFQLHFRQDPDGKRSPDAVLEGAWTGAGHHDTYPVSLTMRHQSMVSQQNQTALERNARAFYFAVLKGDKEKAARYVRYPLLINVDGKRLARNQSEFLRDYDQIFTRDYLACLQKDVPHHMFHRGNEAMIAGGALWFSQNGYTITVNPCRS
jgi:hypothetical protein